MAEIQNLFRLALLVFLNGLDACHHEEKALPASRNTMSDKHQAFDHRYRSLFG
ncbi:hypothetical protein [Enterobacter hormaechei]|uniref:hypothetical protein n=1 Tax=Enterobacter hormaechei TaxID=158836 RepID=UPI000A5A5DE1|nr:hypothetical protein [Enterobacter hormaechei]